MATKKSKKQQRNAKLAARAGELAKKKSKPVQIKRKPRAQRLPGMEDAGIMELENLANDIDDLQTEKKAINGNISTLQDSLVAAMKKHGRTSYSHKGVTINLESSDKVKVVVKDADDTPADNEPAPGPNVSSESLAVDSEA